MTIDRSDEIATELAEELHVAVISSKEKMLANTLHKIEKLGKKEIVNLTDDIGHTPLFSGVIFSDAKSVELLLNAGANVNQIDVYGDTPLHKLLMRIDTNLASSDSSPLTKSEQMKMLNLLLDQGANCIISNHDGVTPQQLAEDLGSTDIMTLVNQQIERMHNILHDAIEENGDDVAEFVQLVLEHGADVNAVDHRDRTPITKAIACGNTALIEVLLKYNAHLGTNDKTAINKLTTAIERKKLHEVAQHRDKHALFKEPTGNIKTETSTTDVNKKSSVKKTSGS